ncbi:uncharacterized protein [Periplaneta americana]|uniref:uncharacterized protein isoform X4 n=1 Tax=Periplaneta americana TaxID=6978 RepID=UPI0037E730BC
MREKIPNLVIGDAICNSCCIKLSKMASVGCSEQSDVRKSSEEECVPGTYTETKSSEEEYVPPEIKEEATISNLNQLTPLGQSPVSKHAAVKNKCQNLRSNPMREKRKLKSSPSCCKAQRSKTTWPFMESMNLLDQTLQARETSGNVNCNILVGNEDLGNGNDRQCFHEEQLGTSTGMQSLAVLHDKLATAKQTGKKRRGRTAKNYFKHLNKTTTKQAEDINDPDLMFLQSLLPLIRHLSPLQNLEFKEEVINLLKQKFNLNQNYLCHIDGIVEDLKARRNSIAGTYPANSLHCEKERVETFDASPSVDSETVNIKSEDDISSNNEVEIKCEPNFDGEDDPLNANDISPNYEGEINCQMSSSCEDDPLNTHKSLNEECETKYQVSVKNEVDLLDVPLTDVKVECRSYEDFH